MHVSSFSMQCQTIYQNSCASLQSHRQYIRVPVFLYPSQYLELSVFLFQWKIQWVCVIFHYGSLFAKMAAAILPSMHTCLFTMSLWIQYEKCNILIFVIYYAKQSYIIIAPIIFEYMSLSLSFQVNDPFTSSEVLFHRLQIRLYFLLITIH